MNAKKILIVEDEIDIVEIYKMKLENSGYLVDVAMDGFNALTKALEFQPDLILLDIMMPTMNGYESLSTIRNLAPSMKNTKIIMFSNLSSKDEIDKAISYGADGYFIKSEFTPNELIQKIKTFFPENENERIIICPHCNKEINLLNITN